MFDALLGSWRAYHDPVAKRLGPASDLVLECDLEAKTSVEDHVLWTLRRECKRAPRVLLAYDPKRMLEQARPDPAGG